MDADTIAVIYFYKDGKYVSSSYMRCCKDTWETFNVSDFDKVKIEFVKEYTFTTDSGESDCSESD